MDFWTTQRDTNLFNQVEVLSFKNKVPTKLLDVKGIKGIPKYLDMKDNRVVVEMKEDHCISHGLVKQRYVPVTNRYIAENLESHNLHISEKHSSKRGPHSYLVFEMLDSFSEKFALTESGQSFPRVIIQNGYDGTRGLRVTAGWYRMVCTNLLIVPAGVTTTIYLPHFGMIKDKFEGFLSSLANVFANGQQIFETMLTEKPVMKAEFFKTSMSNTFLAFIMSALQTNLVPIKSTVYSSPFEIYMDIMRKKSIKMIKQNPEFSPEHYNKYLKRAEKLWNNSPGHQYQEQITNMFALYNLIVYASHISSRSNHSRTRKAFLTASMFHKAMA